MNRHPERRKQKSPQEILHPPWRAQMVDVLYNLTVAVLCILAACWLAGF